MIQPKKIRWILSSGRKRKNNEPAWESPWGKGRPGWHIECSAMIHDYLGDQIDIHGGGRDLIYPHHESEIAQSESYSGKTPFVQNWMHVSMVQYQGEKMSKSLGNLVMVSELIKKYSANAIRYLLLSHHYRKPWEFSYEDMDNAQKQMENIESVIKTINEAESQNNQLVMQQFMDIMDDDLNTPEVLKFIRDQLNVFGPAQTKLLLSTLGFRFS